MAAEVIDPEHGIRKEKIAAAYSVFDKHKSWYKVDIDGDFITKNPTKTETKPKKYLKKSSSGLRRQRPASAKMGPPAKGPSLALWVASRIGGLIMLVFSALSNLAYWWPLRPRGKDGVF